MRITTGMIANQYGRNLNRSLGQLNYYNNRATTGRKFDRASQDPVSAAKAYGLRRSYAQNDEYLTNVNDTKNLFQTAHSTKESINSILQEIGKTDILQAINGSMEVEDRTIVATKIKNLQEAFLANANAKYGDKYMFNGGDYTTPPFTLSDDGALLYRGINVDTGLHAGNQASNGQSVNLSGSTIDFGAVAGGELEGYTIKFSDDTVGNNAFDKDSKTITIGSGDATMTATDLKTQLDTVIGDAVTAGDLPSSIDAAAITAITVTGDSTGIGSATLVPEGEATNESASASVGGVKIDFGSANGDILNGYTINILEDDVAGVTPFVDNEKNVINLTFPEGTKVTKDMLQDALQAIPAGDFPVGGTPPIPFDPSKITISGNTDVAYGTGEITGGEESIAAGTFYDLESLSNETRYVDLGLGLNFSADGTLNTQSVFDISMNGLDMLGFGVSKDGVPNNLYSQLTLITKELENPDFSFATIDPLIEQYENQCEKFLYSVTDTDSKTNFIDFTLNRLDETKLNLNEKMVSVELVDPAEAIMDFKMQEYAYMAALQMGAKIIQPTFLDFMR